MKPNNMSETWKDFIEGVNYERAQVVRMLKETKFMCNDPSEDCETFVRSVVIDQIEKGYHWPR